MKTRNRLVYLVLVILWCVAANAACASFFQAPPSPLVRAFGDSKYWMTVEDTEYIIGSTAERIVVPKGFVTDFASTPESLRSFGLSPHGRYSRAALIHDYLYWSQGCTRAQADRLLVIAMKETNVGSFDEFAIYHGVNLGGERRWNDNANERRAGMIRVVPEQYLHPADPNIPWPEYRFMLVEDGVQDPSFMDNPSYCIYGTSTIVP